MSMFAPAAWEFFAPYQNELDVLAVRRSNASWARVNEVNPLDAVVYS